MDLCIICKRSTLRKKESTKATRNLDTSTIVSSRIRQKNVNQSQTSSSNQSLNRTSLSLDNSRASLASNSSDVVNKEEEWLGCSRCGSWVHRLCAKIPVKVYNYHKNNDATQYLCHKCDISGCFVCYSSTDGVVTELAKAADTMKKDYDTKLAANDRRIRLMQVRIDKITEELVALNKKAVECFGVSEKYKKGVDGLAADFDALQCDVQRMRGISKEIESLRASIRTNHRDETGHQNQINRSSCVIVTGMPPKPGENLNEVVQRICRFLDKDVATGIRSCHRTSPSKDGNTHIIVQLTSVDARRKLMREYFLHLPSLTMKNVAVGDTDHRIIINEMLTEHAFQLRNAAIRLKHQRAVAAVHVRNNVVSVRIKPGKSRVAVRTVEELQRLISEGSDRRETSEGDQSAGENRNVLQQQH